MPIGHARPRRPRVGSVLHPRRHRIVRTRLCLLPDRLCTSGCPVAGRASSILVCNSITPESATCRTTFTRFPKIISAEGKRVTPHYPPLPATFRFQASTLSPEMNLWLPTSSATAPAGPETPQTPQGPQMLLKTKAESDAETRRIRFFGVKNMPFTADSWAF
jgi:hypothetical protein